MEACDIWRMYQRGIEYKSEIGLYDTVTRNERFFAGDQWAGVNAPDLPKPVINFIKRACQQKIAEVKSSPTKVYFSPVEFPSDVPDAEKAAPKAAEGDTALLNALFEADWSRLKMDAVTLDGLQDACLSGDCILYCYWDAGARTGQAAEGQICVEAIDNVNYYPGNPNECDVQKQPYIIIARREPVENVICEAEQNGAPEAGELIEADADTFWQSGDLSQTELRSGLFTGVPGVLRFLHYSSIPANPFFVPASVLIARRASEGSCRAAVRYIAARKALPPKTAVTACSPS